MESKEFRHLCAFFAPPHLTFRFQLFIFHTRSWIRCMDLKYSLRGLGDVAFL